MSTLLIYTVCYGRKKDMEQLQNPSDTIRDVVLPVACNEQPFQEMDESVTAQDAASIADAADAAGTCQIVGIGASAGGLEAIEAFFDNMPPDTGLAFVVVQHLSPDFKSLMDELLARHTKMTIHKVENEMPIEPNSIYLIPPRMNMVVSNDKLLLTDYEVSDGTNRPIDTFFRSLAQNAGERSIAIVLSGTGCDGSRGLRDIHEVGGLVVVQDKETAKFDAMPHNAVATGLADLVLEPDAMPAKLLQYIEHCVLASGKKTKVRVLVRRG